MCKCIIVNQKKTYAAMKNENERESRVDDARYARLVLIPLRRSIVASKSRSERTRVVKTCGDDQEETT